MPHAPKNPYRKRPVKLMYDPNDFHFFKLPSEKSHLLSGWSHEELFGYRHGIKHSPHLKAQMNLDTNLVWIYFMVGATLLIWEGKRTHRFVTLRENYFFADMGHFSEEDFN